MHKKPTPGSDAPLVTWMVATEGDVLQGEEV